MQRESEPSRVYVTLVQPHDGSAVADVRALLEEYLSWLGPLVCSSTLPGEIASLPLPYAPPDGALLIARDDAGETLGCVGIRASEGQACEAKRLYVRADVRRQGIGRVLMRAALDQARAMGYREMQLTTLPDEMPGVVAMYRSLGFGEADAYRHHGGQPADGVLLTYMRRSL
jgi:GNAT superfamily N-acetyltransferase